MLTPTDAIKGAGYKRVALITDGRFSGATTGPCIGHVEMEAFNGGPIGAIKNGDTIEIDIPGRTLNVKLEDSQLKHRLSEAKPPDRQLTALLARFRGAYAGLNCYGRKP
jgi:dihydroxy-acid dehydratase